MCVCVVFWGGSDRHVDQQSGNGNEAELTSEVALTGKLDRPLHEKGIDSNTEMMFIAFSTLSNALSMQCVFMDILQCPKLFQHFWLLLFAYFLERLLLQIDDLHLH